MARNIIANLPHLVKLLIEVVEGFKLPGKRTSRGRPYLYPPKAIVKCFLIMVTYRLPSVRSLARFLEQNRELAQACGLKERAPSYRTLSRRLQALDSLVLLFARQVLQVLVKYRVVDLKIVATDSTLLAARGRKAQKGKPQVKPTDPEARWGWSQTKDWVFGYKLHLTSTVLGAGTLVPLAWSATGANHHDTTQFLSLMGAVEALTRSIHRKVTFSLADNGYDYNANYRWCEAHGQKLVTPVRRFRKQGRSPQRQRALELAETREGRKLYWRRGDNERLIGQLKDVFLLDPLPVKGQAQVASYLSLANLAYLLGVLYNHLNGRSLRAIKSLAV